MCQHGTQYLELQCWNAVHLQVDSSNIQQSKQEHSPASSGKSIHTMTTAEWRAAHEETGGVDLWVEEEFNAGSRLKVLPRQCSAAVWPCSAFP